MNATPILTDRLASYRSTLDAAIEARTQPLDLTSGVEFPSLEGGVFDSDDDRRRPHRGSMVVIGAAAAVAIGGLTVITFNRPERDSIPAGPATTEGAPSPGVTIGTTPATTALGGGASRPCDAAVGDPLVPADTLYLGGPASDQNLARPGAIFALPDGTPAVDVAVRAVGLAVIGYDCNVSAFVATEGVVLVGIDPPASSTSVSLNLRIAEMDDAIAVTAITGSTGFETNIVDGGATLTFREALPAGTARVQVRFKKGDDVWELTADPTPNVPIALDVPAGETDRFPDQPVDWVLFTALDDRDLLLDAGGEVVAEWTAQTAPAGALVLDELPTALADATGYSFAGDPSAGDRPSVRWFNARPDGLPPQDGEPMLWLDWSVADPEQFSQHRLDYTTVIDTTVRDAPAFIATNDPTEHFAVWWSEGGYTYTLGGFGLDQDTVVEAAEQLRPATDADWAELVVEPG
jgi:hypothetical protein